jgi:hypothetical protein
MKHSPKCPFKPGDFVRFSPSERTRNHYQDVEAFGIKIGQVMRIETIKDEVYVIFAGHTEGWPWNEFILAEKTSGD